MAMTLGAQLYTVRDFTKTPEQIETTLRRIRDMCFKTIQISAFGPMDPVRLGELIHELDLYVCVTHNPLSRLQNDLPALIQEHRLMGCDTIGLGAMPGEYRNDEEGFRKFIHDIAPIAHEIHEEGMQFAYHNHNFEFTRFGNHTGMDMLFDQTHPEEFHFILDTYCACRDAGVKDIVIEQDVCPGDPFDSLAISFANLKKLAAEEEASC